MAQHDTFDRVPGDWRELLLVDAALSAGIIDELAVLETGRATGSDVAGSATAIATRLGLDHRATVAVLDALAALDYVTCDRDGYRLTEAARGFLVDEADKAFRRHSLTHNAHQLRRWIALPAVLDDGGPAPAPGEDRDLERFIRAMDDVSRPSAPAVVDALLAAAPGARRVLDAGGGPGTYARELAARGVAATVYDLPDVVELIAPDFADEPLVEYVAGDMSRDLPAGPFDVVLLANVAHIFGPDANRALVARAADSLAPGGVLAIFDFLLGVSPRAAMFAVNMLVATAEGRTYREDEVRGWCADAGLAVESVSDFAERDEQLVIARRGPAA